MEKPEVRRLEIIPYTSTQVALRDPLGISENTLIIDRELLYLLFLMDGTRDIREIQADFMRKTGVFLFVDYIEELLRKLDENFMLNNERFRERKSRIEREFLSSDVREPALSGKAYPGEKRELVDFLERVFSLGHGEKKDDGNVLIVPHIDIERGKNVYAKGFSLLRGRTPPEVILLIGTSHFAEDETPFILTEKDFLTPLGRVGTDKEAVRRLSEKAGEELLKGEFAHKNEHSLEFPLLFLSFLFGTDFFIIPVLVNSFDRFLFLNREPLEEENVKRFVEALREVLKGRDFLCVCGADLSHMGPRFGDPEPIGISELSFMEAIDSAVISRIESGSARLLFKEVESTKNRTRICGFPPIYITISIFSEVKGRLISYEYAYSSADTSVVSFSSILLKGKI